MLRWKHVPHCTHFWIPARIYNQSISPTKQKGNITLITFDFVNYCIFITCIYLVHARIQKGHPEKSQNIGFPIIIGLDPLKSHS